MPYSNYPGGFANGVSIRGVPILISNPNEVLWVDSTVGSNGNKGTFNSPFSTIDYAVGRCTASKGDIILVKPGHTETLSDAASLLLDVAGISIIGMGEGALRPTITLDTATTASIPVSAANIVIRNMIFSANFADIVALFTPTTAANFTLADCLFKATATNMNFLNIVDTNTTDNAADGLTIRDCIWIEPDLATLSLVKADATIHNAVITGNYVNLGVNNNKAALMTVATGKIATALYMDSNRVYRLNTDTATGAILFHTDGSTNTGIVSRNFAQHADTAAELLITATSGLGVFENRASGVAGASGYLLPAADS